MCHIVWGGVIRLSVLQQNCSISVNTNLDTKFLSQQVRTRHYFEIWVVFFKYLSAHINEMLTLCLLQDWVYACGKVSCLPTAVDVKVFPMCIVEAIKLTLVCFCIELLQFLVRRKYYYLESSYEFCSLACSVLSVSSEYVLSILVALGCL
jgi:hypothetical protein